MRVKFKRKDGYASGLEKAVADDLKKRGIKFEYEPTSFSYDRTLRGAKCPKCGFDKTTKKSVYTPDFRVGNVYIETKGRFTANNRTRMADFKRSRPDVDVRILFAADNWCTANKKKRYTDWARAAGFPCAVGKSIPQEWVL